jgi:hypothetical protein
VVLLPGDVHRHRRAPAPGQDLRQQAAERVTDDGRLALEPAEHLLEVVGDVADALVREDLRMGLRLRDRVRIVRPARRHRRVPGFLE